MMQFRSGLPVPEGCKRWFWCLTITVAYVITGRLALLLAAPPGYATAIFPPAGIAMAAVLIAGWTVLPWVFVGSLILNLWAGISAAALNTSSVIAVATVIAAASVAQAALGAWSLRRFIGYPLALDNGTDLGRFLLLPPAVCLTSVTMSLGGMAALGTLGTWQIGSNWFAWWLGDTLGVMFFLPLVMVLAGEPRALWRSRIQNVAVPMLLFFALFVAIFVRTGEWEQVQSLTEFRLLSQGFLDRLQFQLAAQEDLLRQLGVFWKKSERIDRGEFAALTGQLLQRFPAIRAVEWAPRVVGGDRAEYYTVTYVEPPRQSETTVGFDLASDPIAAAAVYETSRTGGIVATAPIALVEDANAYTGVLLTLAVVDRAQSAGVLLFVLEMEKCVVAQLGPARGMVAVQVEDRGSSQRLVDGLTSSLPISSYSRVLVFGGRSYEVTTAPTKLYLAEHQNWQSWAVLVVGLLGTSLLGALLMLSSGERQRISSLLTDRTRERDRIWQVSEDLLGVSNFEGYFTNVNPAWTKTLGWTEEEIRAQHVNQLRHPDDLAIGTEGRRRLAEGAGTVRMENRFRHKDGSFRWIYWTLTAEQGVIYLIGRNITADKEAAQAYKQTEEQLHQLQKMESVGQLTGGIAHDFNNLLTVIVGNLDIVERALDAHSARVRKAIRSAMDGAMKAVTLIQRLLAYAQRQPLRPRGVDLNKLVNSMRDLICRTQGEIIKYEFALDPGQPFCFCDANQLETALLNLVINARDAMENGGQLNIKTCAIRLDETSARMRGISSGAYVELLVTDTGMGMSPEILERAFEPFFTTKGTDRGTGLGLSMVYGFAKQSNGHAEIESLPGQGTKVRILLPALAGAETTSALEYRPPFGVNVFGAGETILVVEDDTEVREHVADVLRTRNYAVTEAKDAVTALAIIKHSKSAIDMLLTDVIMPGMNGRELAQEARAVMPNMRVLFMTGYSQDVIVHQGRLDGGIELIEKPFRSEDLAARVRAMLGVKTEAVASP